MAEGPPSGFIGLYAAAETRDQNQNIMGIVADVMPPSPTNGTDWQISFSLQDEVNGPLYRFKCFHPQSELPKVKGVGDVVLLRGVRHKEFQGSTMFLTGKASTWVVFHPDDIPEQRPEGELNLKCDMDRRSLGQSSKVSQEIMGYALELCNSRDRSQFFVMPSQQLTISMGSGRGPEKFALIEDIQDHKFFDLMGQIVRVYDDNLPIIYITDFTNNKLLYNYEAPGQERGGTGREGDEFGYLPVQHATNWKGPLGQFTLQVTLWEPHAGFFRRSSIKVGDYVELKNVHVRFGKDNLSRLEGVLHGDKQYESRVNIRKIVRNDDEPDEKFKELLRRKRTYVESHGDWTKEDGPKRKATEAAEPKSKSARKRAKQREAKKALESGQKALDANGQLKDADGIPVARRERRALQNTLNDEIVCTNHDTPARQLSAILDRDATYTMSTAKGNEFTLPWQNRSRRAEVRVVDYFPQDLRNFAVRDPVSEYDGLDDDDGPRATTRPDDAEDEDYASDASSDHEPVPEEDEQETSTPPADADPMSTAIARGYRYEWRFALLVEDRHCPRGTEPVRLVLNVGGDDAVYLLDGLSACDLHKRKNAKVLARLQEKLFLLWGNLEEVKQKTAGEEADGKDALKKASSRPFACCIQEYGVRLPGEAPLYERRFSLFGTRIK